MPFALVPFLLLAIPIAEIAVFIAVGGAIGIGWTLLLILLTAVLGTLLLRVQGFELLGRIRAETAAGRLPGRELVHGVMLLVAGVLLLTPGFVTDAIGFSLFVPFVRDSIGQFLARRFTVSVAGRPVAGASARERTQGTHDGFGPRGRFGSLSFGKGGRSDTIDLSEDEYRRGPADAASGEAVDRPAGTAGDGASSSDHTTSSERMTSTERTTSTERAKSPSGERSPWA